MAVVLVASGGGHLKQLFTLAPRLPFDEPFVWAVPQNSLSSSLLAGQETLWLRYNGPRDPLGVARNALLMLRHLARRRDVSAVVTTGASHGLAAWPLAVLKRVPMYFIETAARVEAPSMSGRIAARLPGVRCLVQYPHRADGTWHYAGSVFGSFEAHEDDDVGAVDRPLKVLVTVGAMEDVGFRRMVEAVAAAVPADAEVTWQTGPTDVADLPLDPTPFIDTDRLVGLMRDADVVVSHAGVGSILTSLECGTVPVLFPRYRSRGEHVDDHQLQVAQYLEGLGLAVVVRDGDRLTTEDLRRAARLRVTSLEGAGQPVHLPA